MPAKSLESRRPIAARCRWPAGLFVTLAGLPLIGCQAPQMRSATPTEVPRGSSAELILYISDQPYITAEPAYRAIHALAKGEPFDGEFAELTETLRAERLIGRWEYQPDNAVNRGVVGFMICRACNIRTGVNWNLTGLGRYAWRELIHHGIAVGGGELGLMSGGEFVGLLSRAEEYLRRSGQREPLELGPPGASAPASNRQGTKSAKAAKRTLCGTG